MGRSLTLKARYVFPVSGEPIADGTVTIEGDRIVAVGKGRGGSVFSRPISLGERDGVRGSEMAESGADSPHPSSLPEGEGNEIAESGDGSLHHFRRPEGEGMDLGNVAILPGLVNAHTHLELSGFRQPVGHPGIGFADWVTEVVASRRQMDYSPKDAVAAGLRESREHGITSLGEIAQADWEPALLENGRLETIVFLELIAPTLPRVETALELAREHLRKAGTGAGWQPGLSPHAPYSVRPELLAAVAALSADQRVPVAFHLAESREELELLRSGTGPLRAFLERIGAWDSSMFSVGLRPLDYLTTLGHAHRALVIHGNYLDDEEIAFLGRHGQQMAVVYCPRTHRWFGHAEYPLRRLLAAGATVALGTDSRASSPDLSLLAEMRLVARRFPDIAGHVILELGTLQGARALGLEREVGTLEVGKRADLAIVALPNREAANPHDLLFDSAEPVIGRWQRGRGEGRLNGRN